MIEKFKNIDYSKNLVPYNKVLFERISRIPIILSIISILCIVYDLGFGQQSNRNEVLHIIYILTCFIGSIYIIIRYLFIETRPRRKVPIFDGILLFFIFLVLLHNSQFEFFRPLDFLKHSFWLYTAIFLVFIREISTLIINLKRAAINPAQLFILSFLIIIFIGSLLLLLPNATNGSISVIDAIFTSTSAVCVTGLIVLDTSSGFTQFGQIIILLLIQVGGIGIMTFASYFSYFFRGSSSYENQLLLSQMVNAEKLAEVFSILKKIFLITFLIEGMGAVFIFYNIDYKIIPDFTDRLFFSIFHSVSGFCNAGFSTLSNGLYEDTFRFNYPIHLIIASLIIIGGLGFPIVFNLFNFVKFKVKSTISNLLRRNHPIYMARGINLNTRIVLITTICLLFFGTLLFFIFESNNTLTNHSLIGKIIASFFGSVTARTAGFNTVDMSVLSIPTLLIVAFLMWVGASPGSTGGGIKTSTLALAILNIISVAKGKSRLEVYKREIPEISIKRAFAIIALSILLISISTLCILFFDPDKGLLNIAFECISALSTVGLSTGITSTLSSASKIVLILTMFIGRIGMLTLLIAIFKNASYENYRYPTENILIN